MPKYWKAFFYVISALLCLKYVSRNSDQNITKDFWKICMYLLKRTMNIPMSDFWQKLKKPGFFFFYITKPSRKKANSLVVFTGKKFSVVCKLALRASFHLNKGLVYYAPFFYRCLQLRSHYTMFHLEPEKHKILFCRSSKKISQKSIFKFLNKLFK